MTTEYQKNRLKADPDNYAAHLDKHLPEPSKTPFAVCLILSGCIILLIGFLCTL